ncbi:hypothetical protein ASC97_31050 [Rhizobium sp. Root1203]|nr:hypothetical protein [Rhizobium sp. Root1203]KQV15911.1 hypothetical protein ASC97_31050 [Rhizobium sp. Root1203]
MLVIDDDGRIGIHKADKNREDADGITIGLVEVLTDVCGIKTLAGEICLLVDFAKRCFSCFFALLDRASDLAPFANQRMVPPKKKHFASGGST